MIFLTDAIIKEARKNYPDAENDIEALDLMAQQLYKEIQANDTENFYEDNEKKIHLYHAVRLIREDELEKTTNAVSDYKLCTN